MTKCRHCAMFGPGECTNTPHGTRRGYDYHDCRCDPCRVAVSNYRKSLYANNEVFREAHKERNRAYYYRRKDTDSVIAGIRAKVKSEREAQGLAVASI